MIVKIDPFYYVYTGAFTNGTTTIKKKKKTHTPLSLTVLVGHHDKQTLL